jgi:integrase
MQTWKTVQGTKTEAERTLAEMMHRLNHGQVVEASRMTLGEWMQEWLDTVIQPSRRMRTFETYSHVVMKHLKPKLGALRLCDLRASHLQRYYNGSTLSKGSLQQHHAILHGILKAAAKNDLVLRNVADLVEGKPRRRRGSHDELPQCWEEHEARQFLDAAKEDSPQAGAFYSLALDAGPRRGELCGILWKDVALDVGQVTITRQLLKVAPGKIPVFGPPKNGDSRTLDLSSHTVTLLRRHKAAQSEHRLLLGTAYHDYGLVFTRPFGDPIQVNNLGQREYGRLIKDSGVRKIKFHGLRHTSATLLLKRGTPPHVVSQRLGHRDPTITMTVYAHALPSMQQDAAVTMGGILHG